MLISVALNVGSLIFGLVAWIAVILSVITILLNVFVAAGGQDEREQRQ